jgi:FkbM family methyltransferase
MTLATRIADGLGRDSWLMRCLRPAYGRLLNAAYGRRGLRRCVNGVPLRVLPQYRWYFSAEYDAPVAAFFRARLQPGDVCVSVGANLGVYPLQFAAWSAPGGHVVAFEPNPDSSRLLRRHVSLNGLDDRVRVVQKAVAERPGTATFYAAGPDGMSRLGAPNPHIAERAVPLTVEVETLDAFCAREQIAPNALMIDVEGFEVAVLAGARSLFADPQRRLAAVVEMHPNAWSVAGSDRAGFERLLADLRVRPVPLSGQADPMGDYGHVYLEPVGG